MTTTIEIRRSAQWNGLARPIRVVVEGRSDALRAGAVAHLEVPEGRVRLEARSWLAQTSWEGEVGPSSRFEVGFRGVAAALRHRTVLYITETSSGQTSPSGGMRNVATFALLVFASLALIVGLREALEEGANLVVWTALLTSVTSGALALYLSWGGDRSV